MAGQVPAQRIVMQVQRKVSKIFGMITKIRCKVDLSTKKSMILGILL